MAWILSHAMSAGLDQLFFIFGHLRVCHKDEEITDDKPADIKSQRTMLITIKVSLLVSFIHSRHHCVFFAKFLTEVPVKCWNPQSKEWNHQHFKAYEALVVSHLKEESLRILGLARFRRSGALMVRLYCSPIIIPTLIIHRTHPLP